MQTADAQPEHGWSRNRPVTNEAAEAKLTEVDVEALAAHRVYDAEGDKVELGECWANQRAVLIFLRHFGSGFSTDQVEHLKGELKAIRSLGAEVYLIGCGDADTADAFQDRMNPDCQVYTDPSLEAFRIAGFHRGIWRTFGPRSMRLRFRGFLKGRRPRKPNGDVLQLGGAMVVVPPGRALYIYRSEFAGDLPPLDKAREALTHSGWSHLAG